jgi:hypothetical protein
MADERKPQDEAQDEVKDTEERSEELSDEQLDEVAGGNITNVLQMQHEAKKAVINNLRA